MGRPQNRRRLREPEPHVHLAVHRGRRGQVVPDLCFLARAPVELAEAEVAVGDEGAHAKFASQGEGLRIVAFGHLGAGETTRIGSDLSEEAEGPRFVPALFLSTRRGEGLFSEAQRLLDAFAY
jgi:hypothetical protein